MGKKISYGINIYIYIYIRIAFFIELRLRVSRSLRSLANKIYIYVWRYVCHISSACHVHVMWAELGQTNFLYVPAVSNVASNGNGTGNQKCFKRKRAVGFEFSIQSSVYGATTVAKVSLFSTWTRCTVSFYSM